MMNRRKLFSFLATAPVATVIGAKAAMDANGNDVAPMVGDFYPPSRVNDIWREWIAAADTREIYRLYKTESLFERTSANSRSQRLRS